MKKNMLDFEEYIRQGEPDKKEKGINWQTAIGLQQVDGLKPSAYLLETAKLNIEGDITFDEVKNRIDAYYKTQNSRQNNANDDRIEEADKVSARAAELLSEKTFSLSPVEYIGIHRRLFIDIYQYAGKIRHYDITKPEWVLDGETVLYASASQIKESLEYDFREEKNFRYKGLTKQEQIEHVAKFISGIWQIHAFGEGNTRTTAVFTIKYLRTFGFNIDNQPFAANSWYFRNALVRANYNNLTKNIHATPKYLMRFFGNLLFDESNILKNRELHLQFPLWQNTPNFMDTPNLNTPNFMDTPNLREPTPSYNETSDIKPNANHNALGVKLNANQLKIIALINTNDRITILEMAKRLALSKTAIENNIRKLRENGIVFRAGSDKTGKWVIAGMEMLYE